MMNKYSKDHENYLRIAKAIQYLAEHKESQPQLHNLSAYVGVGQFHLQRLFSEWAGVSPKQFLQYLTKENAKKMLRENSVMDSALSCGLSGS
ncbi:MAG: helix-turn-helix transcriptional regulator, partial [Pseudomonadales bacterium]|nr:helix-turn-helix transcriptional regulator [Pseudomonadales bacterium]